MKRPSHAAAHAVRWRGGATFLLLLAALPAAQEVSAAVEEPSPFVVEGEEPVAAEAKAEAHQGLAALVRVSLPLSSGSDEPLKQAVARARDRLVAAARAAKDGRRPTLVLEIAPGKNAKGGGAGSQFEAVLSLARFLR